MKKLIVAIAITIFCHSVAYANGTATGQSNDETIKKGMGTEKSTTEKDGQHETVDVGNGQTHRNDKGSREATRKEIAHALEKLKSTELKREINLPTLFYRALIQKYPEFIVTIDQFLVRPVFHDGVVELNEMETLSKMAQARAVCDEDIHKDKVLALMNKMIKAGTWIRKQTQHWKFQDAIGYDDLVELVDLTVDEKSNLIKGTQHRFHTAGACRFVGDFNIIQCGECILDVSNRNGMPELTCAGQKTFANGEAGGMKLAITVTESASIRDAQTIAKSDENYKAISDAADNYLRFAVKRDKGYEAMKVKKKVMEKSLSSSAKTDVAVKAMKDQQDPSKILNMLKF